MYSYLRVGIDIDFHTRFSAISLEAINILLDRTRLVPFQTSLLIIIKPVTELRVCRIPSILF